MVGITMKSGIEVCGEAGDAAGLKKGMCSYTVYEKYFGLKQGDLARSMNIKSTDELGKEGFLNSHFENAQNIVDATLAWVSVMKRLYL